MRILLVSCALVAMAASRAPAQQTPRADSARRDPTNTLPLTTTRTVRFTTDEGTWMSVDVSPDGRTIVFDLLGDLYTLPVAGGQATRIVGGTSIDMHPRFSPDGRSIVFISDRNGSDATWIVNADGTRPRLLIAGGSHPVWSPDGQFVLTGNRLVDARGSAGIVLQGVGTAASFTRDGRHIWHQTGTQASRYDRQQGANTYQTGVAAGVLRPLVSPDGRTLVYFTRFEARTSMIARDLATGADRWLVLDAQPAATTSPAAGALPGSAWLPDGSAVITSYGGKLWRVAVPSGAATAIPFTAEVEQALGPLVRGTQPIADSIVVREVREPALSPDGRRVAFSAHGKVWTMDLAERMPRRLTVATDVVESAPVWTPDGRAVVFATWKDGEGGDIFQADAAGGLPRNLTNAPAMYARMNFTRDGSRLVFARAPRRARTLVTDDAAVQPRNNAGVGTELNFELRWMPAAGGPQRTITMVADVGPLPLGGFPHFTADADRVVYHDGAALVSVRWDGGDRRVVLAGAAPQTLLSPDGVHVLSRAGRRRQIYLFERPLAPDSVVIDPSAERPAVPSRRLTHTGGDFPMWAPDGSKAVWSHGSTIFVYDVAQGAKAVADSIAAAGAPRPAADSARRGPAADSGSRWTPAYDAARFDVRIAVASDAPQGVTVLRGGRIVTMNGREVINNGDIVVTGNRITAVGPRGRVTIPRGARIVDVSGKTVLPGYVDIHGQMATPAQVHRTVVSQALANLAFGVTTVRDPESPATDVFAYADRMATGDLLGPRFLATGPTAIDSALTIRNAAEARDVLGVYANLYRSGSVRGDLTASRPDRQRFLATSRELGLSAVALGATDYRRALSAMLDGYSDQHGALDVFPIHRDVAKLIAESGYTWAPMLLGRTGNRTGLEFVLATEKPHDDPRVNRFSYHQDLDRVVRARGTWVSPDEYPFDAIGGSAARILAEGGRVAIGSNGRVQGLALHWEMWLLARAGVHAHDVLRAATVFGADAIGAGAQLGTIEAGKIADLQVLDRDPLANIRNTVAVRYVMKNGRLYDAATLDQVAPDARKLDAPWWTTAVFTEGSR